MFAIVSCVPLILRSHPVLLIALRSLFASKDKFIGWSHAVCLLGACCKALFISFCSHLFLHVTVGMATVDAFIFPNMHAALRTVKRPFSSLLMVCLACFANPRTLACGNKIKSLLESIRKPKWVIL